MMSNFFLLRFWFSAQSRSLFVDSDLQLLWVSTKQKIAAVLFFIKLHEAASLQYSSP